MLIELKFKTPTVNLMYSTFNGHRVKSKEAREKAKLVEEIMEKMELEDIQGELNVEIEIHSPRWYNKDGSIKKRDIGNLEKFITDSIFACLPNMDDKQIFTIKLDKIPDEEECTYVKIEAK